MTCGRNVVTCVNGPSWSAAVHPCPAGVVTQLVTQQRADRVPSPDFDLGGIAKPAPRSRAISVRGTGAARSSMGTSAVIVSPGENTERSVGLMFVFVSVRWAPPVVWATVQPAATAEATTSAPVGELPPRGSAGRWSVEIIKPKRSGSSAGRVERMSTSV